VSSGAQALGVANYGSSITVKLGVDLPQDETRTGTFDDLSVT
jgi:hypothetical protein